LRRALLRWLPPAPPRHAWYGFPFFIARAGVYELLFRMMITLSDGH
jgi:hypothetical protein